MIDKTIFYKKWDGSDVLYKTNYFFNPRVVKLVNRDFEAERIEYDRTAEQHLTVTPGGLMVYTI